MIETRVWTHVRRLLLLLPMQMILQMAGNPIHLSTCFPNKSLDMHTHSSINDCPDSGKGDRFEARVPEITNQGMMGQTREQGCGHVEPRVGGASEVSQALPTFRRRGGSETRSRRSASSSASFETLSRPVLELDLLLLSDRWSEVESTRSPSIAVCICSQLQAVRDGSPFSHSLRANNNKCLSSRHFTHGSSRITAFSPS